MQVKFITLTIFIFFTSTFAKSIEELQKKQEDILHYLGGVSPYVPMKNKRFIDMSLPETCKLNSVQLLQRHGSRYPTKGANKGFKALYDAINPFKGSLNGSLSFFNNKQYKYFVTDADVQLEQLTKLNNSKPNKYTGEIMAREFGYNFYSKYGHLVSENETLTVFASNSTRVKDTAKFFGEGFVQNTNINFEVLVISENETQGMNSLTPAKSCDTFDSDYNDDLIATFFGNKTAMLNDIKQRIVDENPALNLSISNIESIYNYCTYELNVNGYSDMCNLLTKNELTMFDYEASLEHYYSYMNGNTNSSAIASVLLNSSIELLTKSNGNKLNLAWTHDTDLNNFFSLALFNSTKLMPIESMDFDYPFSRNDFTPMGANIILEDYSCGNETYVRYIINDSVYPLNDCNDGPGYGCSLDNFISRAEKLMNGLDFAKQCNLNSSYPQELTFWWDYKNSTSYPVYN